MASDAAQWARTIDEYGELERRYVEAKAWLNRREDLRKKIESRYAGEAADESFSAAGNIWQLIVGPRANRRTIVAMPKLFKLLGAKEFLSICEIPLKKLDSLAIDTDGIVKTERSGNRTITAVPREAPAETKSRSRKKPSTEEQAESNMV
jgi:hypothetical protein